MKASWILLCVAAVAVAPACDSKKSGTGGCEANTDCDSGEICDQGTCYEVCNSDLQCGSGKICTSSRCMDGERSNTPSILSIDGDSADICPKANDTHCLAAGLVIDGEHLEGAELFLSDGTHNWDLPIRDGATASHVEVDLPDVAPGDYTLTAANSVGSVDQNLTLLQGEHGEAYSPTPNELVDDINSATNAIAFARLPAGTGADQVAIGNHVHSGADITSGTIDIAQLPSSLFAGEVSSLADLFQTGFAANPPPVGTGDISEFREWIPIGTSTRFLKTSDTSLLLVTYSGNLRIGANDTGLSYTYLEIRMDNGQMTPRCYQRTHNRVDSATQKNYHAPYQTVCVGENIPKGVHEVSLWLHNDGNSSGGDAYLNWRSPRASFSSRRSTTPAGSPIPARVVRVARSRPPLTSRWTAARSRTTSRTPRRSCESPTPTPIASATRQTLAPDG